MTSLAPPSCTGNVSKKFNLVSRRGAFAARPIHTHCQSRVLYISTLGPPTGGVYHLSAKAAIYMSPPPTLYIYFLFLFSDFQLPPNYVAPSLSLSQRCFFSFYFSLLSVFCFSFRTPLEVVCTGLPDMFSFSSASFLLSDFLRFVYVSLFFISLHYLFFFYYMFTNPPHTSYSLVSFLNVRLRRSREGKVFPSVFIP